MEVVELEINLLGAEPTIFRSLKVSYDICLDRLHLLIQAAMGWENYHLYEFRAETSQWGVPDPDDGNDTTLPANKFTLWNLVEQTGVAKFHYVYDFGDDWRHEVKLGKLTKAKPGELYPKLTQVVGRCPPEDVGGIFGYEEFLEAIANPKHPGHEHYSEWVKGGFDPNTPETNELKFEVAKLARKWTPKKRRG